MKVRDLKSIGFRAQFNEKGKAVLSLPAIELPADAAEAFSPADMERGLRQAADRCNASADNEHPMMMDIEMMKRYGLLPMETGGDSVDAAKKWV